MGGSPAVVVGRHMATVGIVLSGCGALDGTEIHEAFCAMLALSRRGADIVYLAPSGAQRRVVDHSTKKEIDAERDMLVEAARIARGEIVEISAADAALLDTVLIPGGFGAARSLTDFAFALEKMTVLPALEALLTAVYDAGKPLGAVCIATSILAAFFRNRGVEGAKIAMGPKERFVGGVAAMGQTPVVVPPTEAVVDVKNRIVTGSAFMAARELVELYDGIDCVVDELMRMCKSPLN